MRFDPSFSRLGLAILAALIGGCRTLPRSPATVATRGSYVQSTTRLVTVEVGGMVCEGCVAKVRHELSAVPGVERVEVSLSRQRAEVLCGASVADSTLTAAVRRAGPEYLGLIVHR